MLPTALARFRMAWGFSLAKRFSSKLIQGMSCNLLNLLLSKFARGALCMKPHRMFLSQSFAIPIQGSKGPIYDIIWATLTPIPLCFKFCTGLIRKLVYNYCRLAGLCMGYKMQRMYLYISIHIYTYLYMCVYIHACAFVHDCIRTFACTLCTCIYVYTLVDTYIYYMLRSS